MAKDLFGVLAVRKGLATESEVDVALEAQRDNEGNAPLIGEILVDMGTLTPEAVHTVLVEQGGRMSPSTAPRLVQRSGPPVRLNGATLDGVGTAGPGDRVEIGGAAFVLEGAPMELVGTPVEAAATASTTRIPAAAVSPTSSTTQLPAPTPAAEAPAAPAAPSEPAAPKESPFRKADALFARILPSVHNHRKYLALALLPGLFAVVLPWRLAAEQRWVFGIQGPGWATFLCSALALVLVMFGPRPRALLKPEKIAVLSAVGLALLLSLWKLFFPPAYAMAMGIGLPLALLSAIGATLAAAFMKAEPGAFAESAFGLAGRAFRDLSGKRGKEKAAAIEKRDELLRQLGEAALETKGGPAADLDSATKAKAELEKAKKATGPQAKQAVKAAEGKLRRALQKLGRAVVDQNLPLDGRTLPSAEIRDLDARIKELG
jgi:hypothetical protein